MLATGQRGTSNDTDAEKNVLPEPLGGNDMFSDQEIALDYIGKIGNHAALPGYLKMYFPDAPEEKPQDPAQWLTAIMDDDE